MNKKTRITIVVFIVFLIIGLAKVNIKCTEETRKKSNFIVCVNEGEDDTTEEINRPKLVINKNPFKIQLDIKDYIIFVDKSIFENIKNKSNNLITNVREDINKLYSSIVN